MNLIDLHDLRDGPFHELREFGELTFVFVDGLWCSSDNGKGGCMFDWSVGTIIYVYISLSYGENGPIIGLVTPIWILRSPTDNPCHANE